MFASKLLAVIPLLPSYGARIVHWFTLSERFNKLPRPVSCSEWANQATQGVCIVAFEFYEIISQIQSNVSLNQVGN